MAKVFTNNAQLTDAQGNGTIKRYVHQPLDVDHYGIHGKITPDGKVIISGKPTNVIGTDSKPTGEMEYDEVEVPASFIFKLASLLKATRSVHFIPVQGQNQVSE